jgi:hypothetical protein
MNGKKMTTIRDGYRFSIIELLIVIIIFSVFVAGFSGANVLIKSTKIKSIIDEIRDSQTGFLSFNSIKNRIAGDFDRDGKIGKAYLSKKVNEFEPTAKIDFMGEYGNKNINYIVGPWVELFTSGLHKFKPSSSSDDLNSSSYNVNFNTPNFEKITNAFYGNWVTIDNWEETNEDNYLKSVDNGYYLKIQCANVDIQDEEYIKDSKCLDSKIIQAIDEKVDDGLHNEGIFRTACWGNDDYGNNTYDTTIKSKMECGDFLYKVMGK